MDQRTGDTDNQRDGEQRGDDRLRLAELLATRLCHDLAGPLGTLMGALEMATEDPGAVADALPLAGEVSGILGNRLRLLRAAWGGGTPSLSVADFRIMAETLVNRRIGIDLDALLTGRDFSPAAVRLALNVLMLGTECLPAGGVVALSGDPAGEAIATIAGARAAWPAGFAGFLADRDLAWQAVRDSKGVEASRTVQTPLTALIAHQSGLRITMLIGAGLAASNNDKAPPLLLQLGPRAR